MIQFPGRYGFKPPDAPYGTWMPLILFARSVSEETTLWGNVNQGQLLETVVLKECINEGAVPAFRNEVNAMIRLRNAEGEHKVNLIKCGPDEANADVRLVLI